MKAYLTLLKDILENGDRKHDRTGTGTISVFGRQLRFDLASGFPLITTKKLHLRSIIYELLWFLRGDTNVRYLNDNGVSIWNEWADETGELGPIYGYQWRSWPTPEGHYIDQISEIIKQIRNNPDSRRIIVSAWNVGALPDESKSPQANVLEKRQALAPCHTLFQFYVVNGKLSCQLYQRSCDIFLGWSFNCASYSLLTHMIAAQCDLEVGDFIWTGGDVHLYINHIEQAKLQLQRTPYPSPKLIIKRLPDSIFDYTFEDFAIEDYRAHPSIKAPIAI